MKRDNLGSCENFSGIQLFLVKYLILVIPNGPNVPKHILKHGFETAKASYRRILYLAWQRSLTHIADAGLIIDNDCDCVMCLYILYPDNDSGGIILVRPHYPYLWPHHHICHHKTNAPLISRSPEVTMILHCARLNVNLSSDKVLSKCLFSVSDVCRVVFTQILREHSSNNLYSRLAFFLGRFKRKLSILANACIE